MPSYQYKTKPYSQQVEALRRSCNAPYFALLMEQGTGKGKVILDNSAHLFGKGRITCLVVFSLNGMHRTWIEDEVPAHLPDYVQRVCAYWASTPRKAEKLAIDNLLNDHGPNVLRIMAFNYEAMYAKAGFLFYKKLLTTFKCMVALDESLEIKNPKAEITKKLLSLSDLAPYKRILNGTPITQAPFDYYSQFLWLNEDILQTSSFFAFKARYAVMLPANSGLIQHIRRRTRNNFVPQIVATDSEGRPQYKDLDKLRALVEPYSYRVLKKDCLDIPAKIPPVSIYTELLPRQREMYDELRETLRIEWKDKPPTVVSALTSLVRLQQIVGGHFEDRPMFSVDTNPRIKTMQQVLSRTPGQAIIWARFVPEIEQILDVLGSDAVAYYGKTKADAKQQAIKDFQSGAKRYFIGQQQSAGKGLTLTAAELVLYYSNTFNLADRLHSEDRAHRIGQHKPVSYVDIVAVDTIDLKIIGCLRGKKEVADMVTGDPKMKWL